METCYKKNLHTAYQIKWSQTWKVLLHYVQNWQNCAAFNCGNL